MSFLHRVCNALSAHRVRYAVVGGHAVALHGAVRGTVDVDVAIPWTLKSLRQAERALNGLGLVSRLPVSAEEVFRFRDEYVKNRNLIAWNFYSPTDPSEQLDIIITYDLRGKRIRRIESREGAIRILHIDDLIDMKKRSGRSQDLEDAKALERLR